MEFKACYDLVKAAGLVECSYSDSLCYAVVVLAGGEALAWMDARDLLGGARFNRGYKSINMLCKIQIEGVEKGDIMGQISFIYETFGVVA